MRALNHRTALLLFRAASAIFPGAVCRADANPEGAPSQSPAGRAALAGMRGLVAIAAATDVRTGELIASAASDPSSVDTDTILRPLSVAKLWLAASWWDRVAAAAPLSVHEMLVGATRSRSARRTSRQRSVASRTFWGPWATRGSESGALAS